MIVSCGILRELSKIIINVTTKYLTGKKEILLEVIINVTGVPLEIKINFQRCDINLTRICLLLKV